MACIEITTFQNVFLIRLACRHIGIKGSYLPLYKMADTTHYAWKHTGSGWHLLFTTIPR